MKTRSVSLLFDFYSFGPPPPHRPHDLHSFIHSFFPLFILGDIGLIDFIRRHLFKLFWRGRTSSLVSFPYSVGVYLGLGLGSGSGSGGWVGASGGGWIGRLARSLGFATSKIAVGMDTLNRCPLVNDTTNYVMINSRLGPIWTDGDWTRSPGAASLSITNCRVCWFMTESYGSSLIDELRRRYSPAR